MMWPFLMFFEREAEFSHVFSYCCFVCCLWGFLLLVVLAVDIFWSSLIFDVSSLTVWCSMMMDG